MNHSSELENERLRIKAKLKKALIIAVSISILLLFMINLVNKFSFSDGVFFTNFIVLTLAFNGYIGYRAFVTKGFNKEFKNTVLYRIISDIEPNLNYLANEYIDFSEFNQPKMYQHPDIYEGNDLVYGKFEGVEVKFSDINSQEKIVTRDKDGDTKTRYETIFRGICFIADFNKSFSSRTFIRSSNKANVYGERAHMDDSEFERKFDVYTDDQINARYLITPLFMQRFWR